MSLARKVDDPDTIALKTALLLSQQESEFGVNMYNSLTQEDEDELEYLQSKGNIINYNLRFNYLFIYHFGITFD